MSGRKKSYDAHLENDCIVLLSFLADKPEYYQTYYSIATDLSIPVQRVWNIINGQYIYGDNQWALGGYADKYGFEVQYVGKPGELVWVSRKGI